MQGFAIIDQQPGDRYIAVWATNRTSAQRATHVHAVVIDKDEVEDIHSMLRSLTYDKAVLLTDGSVRDDLPAGVVPLTEDAIKDLIWETGQHAQRIEDAVWEHRRRHGTVTTMPVFPGEPQRVHNALDGPWAKSRAFETANYLASAWSNWLATDEQRRRRTVRPQDGQTPWMMPEEMNTSQIVPIPEAMASRVEQAVPRA